MALSEKDINDQKNDLDFLRGIQSDFKMFKRPIDTYSSDFLKIFQDPTYLGFKLFFHGIGQKSSTPGTINNAGLLGPEDNPNSALYYLKQMEGENGARFNMLKDFKALLIRINTEFPWFFQSVEGLEDAWKRDLKKPKFTKELTITCLESIDLRMTALMDLYRKITYDWVNRRYVLPDNLRKFEMTIKVYDARFFGIEEHLTETTGKNAQAVKKAISEAKSKIPKSRSAKAKEIFLGKTVETERTQISFDFHFCEFVPDDSSAVLASVSNVTNNMATQKIKLSYQNVEESNLYKTLIALGTQDKFYYVKDYLNNELMSLDFSGDEDDELFNPINDVLATVGNELAASVTAKAASAVKAKLTNLLLGNVYGFDTLSVAQNPIGATREAVDAIQANNNEKNKVDNTGNNIYEDEIKRGNAFRESNQDIGNIFD